MKPPNIQDYSLTEKSESSNNFQYLTKKLSSRFSDKTNFLNLPIQGKWKIVKMLKNPEATNEYTQLLETLLSDISSNGFSMDDILPPVIEELEELTHSPLARAIRDVVRY